MKAPVLYSEETLVWMFILKRLFPRLQRYLKIIYSKKIFQPKSKGSIKYHSAIRNQGEKP